MARILYSERPYVEELSTNKTRNLIVICERLFLPVQDVYKRQTPTCSDRPTGESRF